MVGSKWNSRCCMRLKYNLSKNYIVSISPSIIFHHHVRYSIVLDSTSTNMGRFYIFGTQIQPLRSFWLIILSYISFILPPRKKWDIAMCHMLGRCSTRPNLQLLNRRPAAARSHHNKSKWDKIANYYINIIIYLCNPNGINRKCFLIINHQNQDWCEQKLSKLVWCQDNSKCGVIKTFLRHKSAAN